MKPIFLAALLAAPWLIPPPINAQVHSPVDCSYAVTPSGLRDCLQLQKFANEGNRSYCLYRINSARSLEAAGVRNAWLQVPTECLY